MIKKYFKFAIMLAILILTLLAFTNSTQLFSALFN